LDLITRKRITYTSGGHDHVTRGRRMVSKPQRNELEFIHDTFKDISNTS